jgi:hypothetical protein
MAANRSHHRNGAHGARVPSEDVDNHVAHDLSALDGLVRLGDGLEREAAGELKT